MPRLFSTLALVLGVATNALGCDIPTTPLSNTITTLFSIKTQNPAIPRVHNYIMNFVRNGDDEHLVLRPAGVRTYDSLWLDNGILRTRNIHAVIDLEYDDQTDTTKLFMTERNFHPSAIFQPVYACDPDTDELQIRLQLVSRQTTPPVLGGQIGIREVVGSYEFRYSPPNNPLLNPSFRPVNMVIFQDAPIPTGPTTTTTTTTTSVRSTTTSRVSTTTTTARSSTVTSSTLSTSTTSRSSTTTTSRSTTSSGPISTPPPQGDYTYVSCWADPDGGRALTGIYEGHDDMTNEKCAAICSTSPNNFQYFGTQWGRECFCGHSLTSGSVAAPESDCSFACAGDATEKCGGSRRLSLYRNEVTGGPTHPSSVGAYNLHGCVTDKVSARTLSAASTVSGTMTLEVCAAFCNAYQYFGTEYATECFCGNSLAAGATDVDISQCSTSCAGNANQFCGNGDRLSVYQRA